jgi:hypothetical protein
MSKLPEYPATVKRAQHGIAFSLEARVESSRRLKSRDLPAKPRYA